MSTRYYLEVNEAIQEKLVGVKLGTAQELREFWTKYGDNEASWDKLIRLTDLWALQGFKSTGYGRLRIATLDLLLEWNYDLALGCENQPRRIEKLLKTQEVKLPTGVSVMDIKSVLWG